MKLLKDIFTDVDNNTYALGAILWATACATYIGLAIYSVVFPEHKFDMQSFGLGFAAVLLAGGYAQAKTNGPVQSTTEVTDVHVTQGTGVR